MLQFLLDTVVLQIQHPQIGGIEVLRVNKQENLLQLYLTDPNKDFVFALFSSLVFTCTYSLWWACAGLFIRQILPLGSLGCLRDDSTIGDMYPTCYVKLPGPGLTLSEAFSRDF